MSKTVRKLSVSEAAYLAGLFDGEGCLTTILSPNKRGKVKDRLTLGLVLVITNTNKNVLLWCQKIIGAGDVLSTREKGQSKRLPCWRFVSGSNYVLSEVLPQLRPYTKIKSPQIDKVLAFIASRKSRPRRSAFNTKEVKLAYDLKLLNQRPKDRRILYKKVPYSLEEFRILFSGSTDSDSYRVVEWSPSMDVLIGTDIDRKIANKLGLKLAQVQRRRRQMGLPPFGRITQKQRNRISDLKLKGFTIVDVARRLGVSRSTVQRLANVVNNPHRPKC